VEGFTNYMDLVAKKKSDIDKILATGSIFDPSSLELDESGSVSGIWVSV